MRPPWRPTLTNMSPRWWCLRRAPYRNPRPRPRSDHRMSPLPTRIRPIPAICPPFSVLMAEVTGAPVEPCTTRSTSTCWPQRPRKWNATINGINPCPAITITIITITIRIKFNPLASGSCHHSLLTRIRIPCHALIRAKRRILPCSESPNAPIRVLHYRPLPLHRRFPTTRFPLHPITPRLPHPLTHPVYDRMASTTSTFPASDISPWNKDQLSLPWSLKPTVRFPVAPCRANHPTAAGSGSARLWTKPTTLTENSPSHQCQKSPCKICWTRVVAFQVGHRVRLVVWRVEIYPRDIEGLQFYFLQHRFMCVWLMCCHWFQRLLYFPHLNSFWYPCLFFFFVFFFLPSVFGSGNLSESFKAWLGSALGIGHGHGRRVG